MGMPNSSGPRTLRIVADQNALAQAAADLFVRLSREATARGSRFTVALSGGSTPRKFHALLAASPLREQVAWPNVEFYWGDERFVPPDDPESNYRMARETLLEPLGIAASQIHRTPTESGDADTVASAYEAEIRRGFNLSEQARYPRFDLILLGMGPDGHTASLFPHTQALGVMDRIVVANPVPKLNTTRITLTAPAINNAANIVFVAGGADKAASLAQVLEGPPNPDEYPSQRIFPRDGNLYWLVDEAAAAQLTRR